MTSKINSLIWTWSLVIAFGGLGYRICFLPKWHFADKNWLMPAFDAMHLMKQQENIGIVLGNALVSVIMTACFWNPLFLCFAIIIGVAWLFEIEPAD